MIYNARFGWAFLFSWCESIFEWCEVEDLLVEKQRINRAMRRWLNGCAAGLICACILASTARAQTAPVAKDDAPKQKAKTSGAKKHSSTPAKSKAETSATKTHRA